MRNFEFMLKSYRDDFKYSEALVQSFNQYNIDSIHLQIIVPKIDLEIFSVFKNNNISVDTEEDLNLPLISSTTDTGGISIGYFNQEIIKLSYWETYNSSYYFPLDSETIFIRHFKLEDFFFDIDIPNIPLIEDKDIQLFDSYFTNIWTPRFEKLKLIWDIMNLPSNHILTIHNSTIFSGKFLKSFKEEFMDKKALSYYDLIRISPYEFSWYNAWIQKYHWGEFRVIEPFIKIFHSSEDLYMASINHITETKLSRSYIGYILNSNFSRAFTNSLEDSLIASLSKFLTPLDFSLLCFKFISTLPVRFKQFCLTKISQFQARA